MLEEGKDRLIIELIAKVDALTSRLLVVEARCTYLEQENKALRKENKQLRARLLRYETPKNSSNSSLPPSSDMYSPKKNQSLRITSGNKAGAQVGLQGKTLEMVSCPDHVIDHKPFYCTFCQSTLEGLAVEQIGRRQVIDIPPIKTEVSAHRIYSCTYSCGHLTKSTYPSEGGIHDLLGKFQQKSQPMYGNIKSRLLESIRAVGADETSLRVCGENHWAWTWQKRGSPT